jgi:hypothetical protein
MTTWCGPLRPVVLAVAALIASAPAVARAQAQSISSAPPEAPSLTQPGAPAKTEGEPAAPPATEKSDFGAELRGYMGFGGEKIAEVEYSDGSRSDLSLGTYFFLGVGGIYSPWRSGPMGLDLELLAGWATWSTGPENTDDRIRLSRFPLEALAYYRHVLSDTPDGEMLLRVGGGVSYHLIGGVSGTGSLDDVSVDFDNALGGVIEAAFVYTAIAGGVRYSPMKYHTARDGQTLDASSVGAFLSLLLEPGLF